MANIDWYIEGIEFGNCNCNYGCPCQFEDLPTHGNCRGFEVLQIERGHFGDVKLDGLRCAVLYAWPGPIFEGKGELQAIIDERASPEQRDALEKVLAPNHHRPGRRSHLRIVQTLGGAPISIKGWASPRRCRKPGRPPSGRDFNERGAVKFPVRFVMPRTISMIAA